MRKSSLSGSSHKGWKYSGELWKLVKMPTRSLPLRRHPLSPQVLLIVIVTIPSTQYSLRERVCVPLCRATELISQWPWVCGTELTQKATYCWWQQPKTIDHFTQVIEMKFGILTRTVCLRRPLKSIHMKNLDIKYKHSSMVSVVIETEDDSKNDGGGSLAEMWPQADLLNWIHS